MSQGGMLSTCMSCGSLERHRIVRSARKPLLIKGLCRFEAIQFSLEPLVDKEWFESLEVSIFGKRCSPSLETIRRPAVM